MDSESETSPHDFAILDGDSRFELMAQLNDVGRMGWSKRPTFRLEICKFAEKADPHSYRHRSQVRIDGHAALSNSGHKWWICGVIDEEAPFLGGEGIRSYFEGGYDTRTRKGWMRLTDQAHRLHPLGV